MNLTIMIIKKSLVFLCFALTLTACSNRADTEPKAVITEKAQARWDVRIAGELDKMYAYLAPSSKVLITEQSYVAKFRNQLMYKKAKVSKIKCDNEKVLSEAKACDVSVDVTYEFRGMQAGGTFENTRPIKEKWIKEDGDWWIYDN